MIREGSHVQIVFNQWSDYHSTFWRIDRMVPGELIHLSEVWIIDEKIPDDKVLQIIVINPLSSDFSHMVQINPLNLPTSAL